MSVTCVETRNPAGESGKTWLYRRAFQRRVPISGSIELTQRCNFRCVHCYLGGEPEPERLAGLGTGEVLDAIGGAADCGCLFLVLTGGEALLRPDFAEIYRFARTRGMLVTVFTNGTPISEDHLRLFRELPPHAVEVTLYGMTEQTYERVTRVKGAYAKVVQAIEGLKANRIPFRLKTVLLTLNEKEIPRMRRFAEGLGIHLRLDCSIFPTLGGDKSPLKLRLSPEEAVVHEFANPTMREQWNRLLGQCGNPVEDDRVYSCGAGRTAFSMDAAGVLQPCVISRSFGARVGDGGFREAWEAVGTWVASQKRSGSHPCGPCTKKLFCGYCPPFSELETGRGEKATEFLCRLGQARYEMVYSQQGEMS